MSSTGDQLYEVKEGNSVADRTEQCRAITHEDDVSLLVHRPNKVRELDSVFNRPQARYLEIRPHRNCLRNASKQRKKLIDIRGS
jgi:hypothetical protein